MDVEFARVRQDRNFWREAGSLLPGRSADPGGFRDARYRGKGIGSSPETRQLMILETKLSSEPEQMGEFRKGNLILVLERI